ncbi:MAG: helix-turn-helix domain-containing protein [Thermodesulfobacteriota bacterium]
MEDELFTVQQAADYLRISVREIQRLCQQRRIDFYQISPRKRLFARRHIQDFLNEVTVTSLTRKKVDRNAAFPVPCPQRGGETKSRLQEDSRKGFSSIRKELSTL